MSRRRRHLAYSSDGTALLRVLSRSMAVVLDKAGQSLGARSEDLLSGTACCFFRVVFTLASSSLSIPPNSRSPIHVSDCLPDRRNLSWNQSRLADSICGILQAAPKLSASSCRRTKERSGLLLSARRPWQAAHARLAEHPTKCLGIRGQS